jgi:chromosome partitioning protein
MIILVGGEKGGSGKTTIATNLAAMLAGKGRDVLLVDTDTQGSASFWAAARTDHPEARRVTTMQKHGRAVAKEVQQLAPKFQDIVIDSGGRDSAELRSAMLAADIILVPSRPSMYDIHSLSLMNSLVDQSHQYNPELQAFVLVNGAPTNAASADVTEMREVVADFAHLRTLDTVLRDRVVYRRSAAQGLSVPEYQPRDAKGVDELDALLAEVTALLKVNA